MGIIQAISGKIGSFLSGLRARLFPPPDQAPKGAASAKGRSGCLAGKLEVDLQWTQWVRVRRENGEGKFFSREELTPGQVVQLMDQTLDGQYVYFAMDFQFQGEGEYVKRLKKTVYRPFHSTLVLHQGSGNLACLFFAGDSMCCYMLIGNYKAYFETDISELCQLPVGDAKLSEDMVFRNGNREEIDKALCALFSDLEHADSRLAQSKQWGAQIAWPGGANNYNRRRRELGLLTE